MGIDLAEMPTKLREVERTDFQVRIGKDELPWFPEDNDVHLVKIKVGISKFLFGSSVQSKGLVDIASKLDSHRSNIANNLLQTHLPQFSDGFNPHVRTLNQTVTRHPIFYVSNNGGQRVFFMRFGKIDNMPVIVRIAVCDKTDQVKTLKILTNESKKHLKAGL